MPNKMTMPNRMSLEDWLLMWDAANRNVRHRQQACDAVRAAYYRSDDWTDRKQPVWNRARGRCERCKMNPGDDVHHLHYRTLFREQPEDLMFLCRGCHDFLHGHSAVDPKDWRTAKQEEFWRVGEAA